MAGTGSALTVENTFIHGTRGDPSLGGCGIGVGNAPSTHIRGKLTVTSCLVDDAQSSGIMIGASDATVSGTLVRNTVLLPGATLGRGDPRLLGWDGR